MLLWQFCVLFALSNTSVLLKVFLESQLWRWKVQPLNIDGFTRLLANSTKTHTVAKECSPQPRTVQGTIWIWLRRTNSCHQTKWTSSFTTSTAQETLQIGHTLLAAVLIVLQFAKCPRTDLQRFKTLKANLVHKAAVECSCLRLAFRLARFADRTFTLQYSGLKASRLLVSCRTVVPRRIQRQFGVRLSSKAIDRVLFPFRCLPQQFQVPCPCLTAQRTCSLSHRLHQRIIQVRTELLEAIFSATVVKRRLVWKPECRLYPQGPMRQRSRVILLRLSHITLAQS